MQSLFIHKLRTKYVYTLSFINQTWRDFTGYHCCCCCYGLPKLFWINVYIVGVELFQDCHLIIKNFVFSAYILYIYNPFYVYSCCIKGNHLKAFFVCVLTFKLICELKSWINKVIHVSNVY